MVKTLTKSIRQYKKESILSPILVSLEVTLECLIPLYMMTMLNKIQVDNSLTNILKWGGILLALAAAFCLAVRFLLFGLCLAFIRDNFLAAELNKRIAKGIKIVNNE